MYIGINIREWNAVWLSEFVKKGRQDKDSDKLHHLCNDNEQNILID